SLVVVAALVRSGEPEVAAAWLRAVRLTRPEAAQLDPSPDGVFVNPAVARRAAVHAHVGLSVVAVRAAELGHPEVARDTAELVLEAEPTSVEARVAAL